MSCSLRTASHCSDFYKVSSMQLYQAITFNTKFQKGSRVIQREFETPDNEGFSQDFTGVKIPKTPFGTP